MKNRILPFCFSAFFLGFSLLLFQNVGIAGNPGDNSSVTGPLNLSWKSLGPDNVAGRTRAVLFDSRDTSGNTMYAGSVTGGIWKSINHGLTWYQLVTSTGDIPKVTCMIQAQNGTIYAGTGEDFCVPNFSGLKDYNYTTSFIGNGLWFSEDGNVFNSMPGTQPIVGDITSDWAFVNKLAIDARNGRLFAATNTGLKYQDQGTGWQEAMHGYTREVKIGSDGTILTQIDDSCYIANAGDINNFVNLSTDIDTMGLPQSDVGRVEFAIAPSDVNVMYASITKKSDGNLMNVYASFNKGVSWSIILPGNTSFDPYAGKGCYASTLVVFPTDPYMLLLGGQDMWLGRKILPTGFFSWEQVSFGEAVPIYPLYIPLSHHCYSFRQNDANTLLVGSDGGVTIASFIKGFETGNKNYKTSQFYSIGFTYAKNIVIGGVQGMGTQLIDGTLNTPEAAKQVWADNSTGGDAAISLIKPNIIIYSMNGGLLRSSDDRGATFSLKFPGTGITNSLNYIMPLVLWESFNFTNSRDSITYYARDAAVESGQSVLVYSPNGNFPFYYTVPVAVPMGDSIRIQDIIQSRVISAFTKNASPGLYMTKDVLQYTKDPVWFQIAKIPDGVISIAVSKDMNYIFAGTKSGKIYRVSNLSLAYDYATADVNSPTTIVAYELVKTFPGNRAVTSISFSPEDNNWAVFTLGNYGFDDYIYMTSNALDSVPTFVNVQGDLPKIPVYSSLVEMHDKNKVIIGTDNGIFSTDNISSGVWSTDNAGLGTVPVFMLKQQTTFQPFVYINDGGKVFNYPGVQNYGAIYAASYGMGLFLDTTYYNPMGIDPRTVHHQTSNKIYIFPNPVNNQATVFYTLGVSSDVSFFMYDISGRTVKILNQNHVTLGEHQLNIDMVGLPAGTYVIQMKSKEGNAFGKVMKVN
jgi:Secretion system C-terminal sorting domain